MNKTYISQTVSRTPRPRSKRLQQQGIGTTSNTTVVLSGSGGAGTTGTTGDGHTHANKPYLDEISTDTAGYEYLTQLHETTDPETGEAVVESRTEKVKAGYADVAGDLSEDSPIRNMFLSRLSDDVAKGNITFEQAITVVAMAMLKGGATYGEYVEKTSGAKIDAEGNAELNSLLVRLKAIVDELQVNGNAEFRGNLSSEEFLSGFVGGKGWAILKQAVTNALGETENKYTAEFDNVVVRGTLRVFTMAISQLLGENDNRIFAGMMEVDHYDAESGKVYLSTNEGRYYNPFRVDDYIMVQQYNGMPSEDNDYYITKHYECIITGAGCGSEEDGENRLDWVTISNFVSADGKTAEEVIKKGDTFTRVDNATDADRKGIIQIITVGTATPYMDIIYGLKTDPDNYLKGRLGNLKGIKHHLFGWLDGFGEYLTNLYAVGDFRLRRTGESLDAAVQMTENQFATNYSKQIQTITEEDNYLTNASFSDMADDAIAESPSWVVESSDEVVITTSDKQIELDGTTYDAPILFNGALSTTEGKFARVEPYDGRNMLHIRNSKITQLNANIRKPGTHTEYVIPTDSTAEAETKEVKDTLYLTLKFLPKTSGTLTLGMEAADHSEIDAMQYVSKDITSSYDWTTLQVSGTWDGNGDFVLGYTGEMYVALLSLTDKPLEEYKKSVSTNIEQTAEYIRLTGQRIDKSNNEVTNLGIELDAAEARIRSYVESLTAGLSTKIEQTAEKVEIQATRFNDDGTLRNTSGLMTEADRNVLYSEVRDAAGELVNKAEISTSVQYDPETKEVTSNVTVKADKIALEGYTTINEGFAVDQYGNMTAKNGTFDGKVTATSGKIGNFEIENGWLKTTQTSADTAGYISISNTDTRIRFGDNLAPATTGGSYTMTAEIYNANGTDAVDNFGFTNNCALMLTAAGAATRKTALLAKGLTSLYGGMSCLTVNLSGTSTINGVTQVGGIASTAGYSTTFPYSLIGSQNEFMFQVSKDMVFELPTITQMQYAFGKYPFTPSYYAKASDGTTGEASVVDCCLYHMTLTNNRYSSGSLYVQGTSSAPLINGSGEIHNYNKGTIDYGRHIIKKGSSVTFLYFNRSWYIVSVGAV